MGKIKKKKYESPKCFDLGAKSRTVTGEDVINGCFSGSAAGAASEQCETGTGGWTGPVCSTGSSPGQGDCISGNNPWYCEAGGGGSSDPDGCRTGMQVT